MDGRKAIISIQKDNYVVILDSFNPRSIFAQVMGETFCVSPFIHFCQEAHEPNALLCFFKKKSSGKYLYEIVSKSQNKEFEVSVFELMENKLKNLVI